MAEPASNNSVTPSSSDGMRRPHIILGSWCYPSNVRNSSFHIIWVTSEQAFSWSVHIAGFFHERIRGSLECRRKQTHSYWLKSLVKMRAVTLVTVTLSGRKRPPSIYRSKPSPALKGSLEGVFLTWWMKASCKDKSQPISFVTDTMQARSTEQMGTLPSWGGGGQEDRTGFISRTEPLQVKEMSHIQHINALCILVYRFIAK